MGFLRLFAVRAQPAVDQALRTKFMLDWDGLRQDRLRYADEHDDSPLEEEDDASDDETFASFLDATCGVDMTDTQRQAIDFTDIPFGFSSDGSVELVYTSLLGAAATAPMFRKFFGHSTYASHFRNGITQGFFALPDALALIDPDPIFADTAGLRSLVKESGQLRLVRNSIAFLSFSSSWSSRVHR